MRDDRIRSKEDLEKLFPGVPVFQMPEDAEKLTELLVNLKEPFDPQEFYQAQIDLKRPKPEDVDVIMREYGDGTAQGEDYGKPETD